MQWTCTALKRQQLASEKEFRKKVTKLQVAAINKLMSEWLLICKELAHSSQAGSLQELLPSLLLHNTEMKLLPKLGGSLGLTLQHGARRSIWLDYVHALTFSLFCISNQDLNRKSLLHRYSRKSFSHTHIKDEGQIPVSVALLISQSSSKITAARLNKQWPPGYYQTFLTWSKTQVDPAPFSLIHSSINSQTSDSTTEDDALWRHSWYLGK